MNDPQNGGQNGEAPLSPEAKAILAKARRSFGFSIGILLLGFMAIGFALVYRAMRDAPEPQIAPSFVVPTGAEVISAVVADGAVNVTYRIGGVVTLVLFDQESGKVIQTVAITAP